MREIVSPLSGIRSPFGGRVDPYKAAGFRPTLVADMSKDYFRNTSRQTFDDLFTHSRLGNATMVDSDGLLKWAPHNLLTYSEQFDNAAWTKTNTTVTANATTAPDGTATADQINVGSDAPSYIRAFTSFDATQYDMCIWVKANTVTVVQFYVIQQGVGTYTADIDLTDGSVANVSAGLSSVTATYAGDGWYLIKGVRTFTAAASNHGFGIETSNENGNSYYVWGAHLYRSDLGGMAPVPADARVAGSKTYVPTTSTARYLPRRHNHVYNGSAWVDAGTLIETEARTNLCTASNDLSSSNWVVRNTDSVTFTADQTTGPDGEASLGLLSITDTTNEDHGVSVVTTLSADTDYTLSAIVKHNTQQHVQLWLYGASNHWAAAVFDISSGTVTDTQTGATSGTITATAVENLGGGLYRISMAAQVSDVSATEQFGVCFVSGSTPTLSTAGLEAYAGTAGVGSYVGYVNLEAASTPSSYIPTSGSTVTRAADTNGLTIDSSIVPWPTPKVIGDELVTNGDFSTDSDWTKGTGWSISGGKLEGNATGGVVEGVTQTVGTVSGKVYQITFDVDAVSGNDVLLNVGSSSLGTQSVLTAGSKSFVFTSAANNEVLQFRFSGASTAGDTITIDNISVKEINPLAVCIQMEGDVTGDSYTTLRWYTDANNYITQEIGTSDFTFEQAASGTVDSVTGGSITSGVNVPFNVASYHGSTFVGGAVSGTALTADTTPVALPDLSSTDLQIGYDFMGNIEEVRVWAVDIGDTGLEAATS